MGSNEGESSGSLEGSTSCRAVCSWGEKVGRGGTEEGGGEEEVVVATVVDGEDVAVSAADFFLLLVMVGRGERIGLDRSHGGSRGERNNTRLACAMELAERGSWLLLLERTSYREQW